MTLQKRKKNGKPPRKEAASELRYLFHLRDASFARLQLPKLP